MIDINKLFFDLIRVAIGNQVCLSHTPSADEWGELYAMAKKQSLVGVCFAGVQRLQKQEQCPPEMMYLQWIGIAAKIQQRNEVVAKRSVELQSMFKADGYRTSVLKGQDYARFYDLDHELSKLRQSGDIDLWVKADRNEVIAWARKRGVKIGHIDIKHSDIEFFADTDVEVHFQPSWMYCPKTNKVLLKWFEEFDKEEVLPLEFSLVYCMVHIYRHFFSEGIGLRQVLDYYFLLTHSTAAQREDAMKVFERLHMEKAVAGVMYLLTKCFGLDDSYLLCEPDVKLGKFLLKEMMTSGNFGHEDSRFKHLDKSLRWQRGWIGLKRNMKFLKYFPEEVMWSPIWKVWHYCWRKRKGYL